MCLNSEIDTKLYQNTQLVIQVNLNSFFFFYKIKKDTKQL